MRIFCLFLLCLATLLPTTSLYSQARMVNRNRLLDSFRQEPVSLNVMVLSKKSDTFVGNLKAENFLVQEDGKKQEISRFLEASHPLSILLLIDLSASMYQQIQPVLDSLQALGLNELTAEDEIALMSFSNTVNLVQDFTKDKQLVAEKLRALKSRPAQGSINIIEALFQTASFAQKPSGPNRKRVLIVVTDNLVSRNFKEPTKAEQKEFFKYENIICGIILPKLPFDDLARQNPRRSSDPINTQLPDSNGLSNKPGFYLESAIQPYVEESGGIYSVSHTRDKVGEDLSNLIRKLRHSYTIEYYSTDPRKDGRQHKIKITLSPEAEKTIGKTTIRHQQIYYAPDLTKK
jgi:VWFA-related protein